jgi:NAD(P)-dependent dehydrogenase (short-subunit alcohol dehydrogenase family)
VVGQLDAAGHDAPPGCELRELDVRDEAAVDALVAHLGARLAVVVNNAALTGPPVLAPLLDHPADLYRAVVETNLVGPFLVSRAAARAMVAAGVEGRIVNVASIDSFVAEEFAAGYVAAKSGVLGLTRACAVELAPHRITVNAVAPGQILSEAGAAARTVVAEAQLAYRHYRAGPLGEAGEPRDVAAAVAWLASPEARWVTGTTLVVDGGYLAS